MRLKIPFARLFMGFALFGNLISIFYICSIYFFSPTGTYTSNPSRIMFGGRVYSEEMMNALSNGDDIYGVHSFPDGGKKFAAQIKMSGIIGEMPTKIGTQTVYITPMLRSEVEMLPFIAFVLLMNSIFLTMLISKQKPSQPSN